MVNVKRTLKIKQQEDSPSNERSCLEHHRNYGAPEGSSDGTPAIRECGRCKGTFSEKVEPHHSSIIQSLNLHITSINSLLSPVSTEVRGHQLLSLVAMLDDFAAETKE